MAGSTKANPRFRWRVVKASEEELESTLNDLEAQWEIFSVTPTIQFGPKVLGAPVPSEVAFTVVARRPEER